MRALLERRDFRLLIGGQTVSSFGDWMATVAFMAVVFELTDSSAAVAGVLVIRLAPTTVAGPVVARLVQRWDQRRVMMTMDVFRAAVVAVVPFVSALWWVYVWAFVLEVASLVFLPARDAAIPDLAGEDANLETANGLVLASSYATIPLGAGAFGAVAALTGSGDDLLALGPVFWVDAATFLVSFELVRRIGALQPSLDRTPGAVLPGETGFLSAFRIPLVRAVLPATAAAALGIGALFSLGIVFVREVLGASNTQFGVLIALFGLGATFGLAALQAWSLDPLHAIRTAVAVQGSVISLMSLSPNVGVTFVGAAGFGAGASASLAAGMSYLQKRLRNSERVLAFAAFHVVIRATLAVAAIGAGVAADIVERVHWPVVGSLSSPRLVLFCSGLVVVAGGLIVRPDPLAAEDPST